MTTTLPVPSPEELALLGKIVRDVTRRRRMSPQDSEDFAQSVQVRLLERDYDILRRFSGRSSLATYLRVVVQRLLLDWQNSRYGKWRPSVSAVRLGEYAIDLERLIYRDGYTTDEAIELVRSRTPIPSAADLRQLAGRLTPRTRRRDVPEEAMIEAGGVPFDDPVIVGERRQSQTRIRRVLSALVRRLPPADRQLLRLRFQQKHTVRSLAERFETDPKVLYRRFERVLRSLRQGLEERGISGARMLDSH